MSDKYPTSSSRRRFVKGVVGSASLSAVGATGAVAIDSVTTSTGTGGGVTQFYGVENTDGPAPRAMPLVPIEIDDEGFISGRYPEVQEVERQGETVQIPQETIAGTTYSVDWFQYCGVQGYAGIQPGYDGDNYFRYSTSSPQAYEWQKEQTSDGDRVNIEDFQDYETWTNGIGTPGIGKPGLATWRSENTENTIPVEIIRSERIERATEDPSTPAEEFLAAATSQGVMAHLNKCTHFCCVPSFKAGQQAIQFGGENRIYCPCHQSIYNPFNVVRNSFVAFPRPEGE